METLLPVRVAVRTQHRHNFGGFAYESRFRNSLSEGRHSCAVVALSLEACFPREKAICGVVALFSEEEAAVSLTVRLKLKP